MFGVEELRRIIRKYWGYDDFRPLQAEAMQCVVAHQDSVVVLPTVIGATLAAWVLVEALRARRMARTHPDQPAFSVLADGRLPGVVAGLVALPLQRLATAWAWDRSTSEDQITRDGWAMLLVCAPLALGLIAVPLSRRLS